jgi:anti-anti-sigma factor
MLLSLSTLFTIAFEASIATFVVVRAWDYWPARILLAVLLNLMLLSISNAFRQAPAGDAAIYALFSLNTLALGFFTLGMLLLFSSILLPEWWQGRRPIIWIAAPYLLAILALAIDLAAGLGWFVAEVQMTAVGYDGVIAEPGGIGMYLFWTIGLGVALAILVVGFIRQPRYRWSIALLALAVAFVTLFARLNTLTGFSTGLASLLMGLPIPLALAYMVLRTTLLTPNRVGLELAISTMNTLIAVVGRDGRISFSNPAARQVGFAADASLAQALAALDLAPAQAATLQNPVGASANAVPLPVADRYFELRSFPIYDRREQRRGTLLMGQDVTELVVRNGLLEQERCELASTLQCLEQEQQQRRELSAQVRRLSLPLIPVMDGVMVLPLIGDWDESRAQDFVETLLQGIERANARMVLLDITGVTVLDTQGAMMLLQAVQAARLLGARCMLVGTRPEIAQTLVSLGVDMTDLDTAATLQDGISRVLRTT